MENLSNIFVKITRGNISIDTIYVPLTFQRCDEMYISLADSRANGFVKWADGYQPEKPHEEEDEGRLIATQARAEGAATPAEPPHRPWLVPGTGRL
jgi:hypothetical protein